MQRFCHNCGDPIEEGEVFCDKCGTKVIAEDHVQTSYTDNNSHLYSDNLTNQRNQSYQQIINAPVKKPSVMMKFAKVMMIISAIGTALIIVLVIIGSLLPDDPVTPPNTPTVNSNTNTNTTKPAADKALVTWTANIKANSSYVEAEKKIYVDYSVELKNAGTGKASNVKAYLNPTANDENAKYLSITTKTIVNLDENIAEINAGEIRDVKTKFFYSNVSPSSVTQPYLQDIANRYIRIPVVVEWQENGKTYTQSLITQ
jgi:uncharacterized membrane protein YvbJ